MRIRKGEIMKLGLIALLAAGAWSARPAHSAFVIPPVLVSNKDTVAGIEAQHWDSKGPWLEPNFIRIRNTSAQTIFLDSLRIPSDSIGKPNFATRLEIIFAAHISESVGGIILDFTHGQLKNRPIAVLAGDSVDLGQFEIGRRGGVAKASATDPHRYQPEDSIVAPLTLFAGRDSINFTLKAKVKIFTYGPLGIAVRAGRRQAPAESWPVTVDGRSASEAQPVARILFR
jgi:hypothetical protein